MNLWNRFRPTVSPMAFALTLLAFPVGALTLQAASRADGPNEARNAVGCTHAMADCAKGMPDCEKMAEECEKRMPGCEKMAAGQMKANCPMMSGSAPQGVGSEARTGPKGGVQDAVGRNPGHCMR